MFFEQQFYFVYIRLYFVYIRLYFVYIRNLSQIFVGMAATQLV